MPADICRFADFELDRSAYQLRRKGRPARIERIPLDLLFLLAERPGQLVTREEILERIWGKDVFLDTDNSINAAIRKIRQVLRDDAETPRFVATVPTKGYRFIASLHETQRETPGDQSVSNGKNEVAPPQIYVARPEPESFEPPSGPADAFAHGGRVVSLAEEAELCKPPQPALRPHTSVKTVGAGAMSALVFIAALLIWRWMGEGSSNRPSSPTVHTIAVLPLENLSGDPGQEYFADGMTDELITDLAKISGLRVISRTSVMRFKGEHRERLAEIARVLGVDTIVEGTVLRVGDKVRITAQLIDAPSDKHLWAESYERDTGDVMTLQDELASTIARQINVELTPDEQARLAKPHPVDPHELEAILKGFYFVTKQTGGGMQKGREYFEQAIKIAPGHAWGYIGLATYYVTARPGPFQPGSDAHGETAPHHRAATRRQYCDGAFAARHHLLELRLRLDRGGERKSSRNRVGARNCLRAWFVWIHASIPGAFRGSRGGTETRATARSALSVELRRARSGAQRSTRLSEGPGAMPQGDRDRPQLLARLQLLPRL